MFACLDKFSIIHSTVVIPTESSHIKLTRENQNQLFLFFNEDSPSWKPLVSNAESFLTEHRTHADLTIVDKHVQYN